MVGGARVNVLVVMEKSGQIWQTFGKRRGLLVEWSRICQGRKRVQRKCSTSWLDQLVFLDKLTEKNEYCKKDFRQDRAKKVHSNFESAESDMPHDIQVEMSSICLLFSLSFNIEETWICLDSRYRGVYGELFFKKQKECIWTEVIILDVVEMKICQ